MTWQVFDWAQAARTHRPKIVAFLRSAKGSGMTEGEFVAGMKALGLSKTPPNRLKNEYRTLKNKFNFFNK